jgi:hypothetical protein
MLRAKVIPFNLQIYANVMRPLDAHYIFLYFESHKKSLKQLHVIVCFSSAFTIYQHILLTNVYLEEISRKELYRILTLKSTLTSTFTTYDL